jgi:hypothetical protein
VCVCFKPKFWFIENGNWTIHTKAENQISDAIRACTWPAGRACCCLRRGPMRLRLRTADKGRRGRWFTTRTCLFSVRPPLCRWPAVRRLAVPHRARSWESRALGRASSHHWAAAAGFCFNIVSPFYCTASIVLCWLPAWCDYALWLKFCNFVWALLEQMSGCAWPVRPNVSMCVS